MGLKAWAGERRTRPAAQELQRRLLAPPNGDTTWATDAWATASCWSAVLDHFAALAAAAHDGDAEACGILIQQIDRSMDAVALLLAEIPLAGSAACAQAVDLMRTDFGTGALPDPELMDHITEWITTAVAAGNFESCPIGEPAG